MKIVYFAGVMGLMLLTDVAIADEMNEGAAQQKPGQIRVINTTAPDKVAAEDSSIVDEDGVNTKSVMPPYETYDPNTRLPDNVPSDAEGNL